MFLLCKTAEIGPLPGQQCSFAFRGSTTIIELGLLATVHTVCADPTLCLGSTGVDVFGSILVVDWRVERCRYAASLRVTTAKVREHLQPTANTHGARRLENTGT